MSKTCGNCRRGSADDRKPLLGDEEGGHQSQIAGLEASDTEEKLAVSTGRETVQNNHYGSTA